MDWIEVGPELTIDRIRRTQQLTKAVIPEQVIWMLQQLGNGGAPERALFVPIFGEPSDDEMRFHGMFGVEHPNEIYDLQQELEFLKRDKKFVNLWPIGFDEGDGIFFMGMVPPHYGQIRWMPYDEAVPGGDGNTYLVAPDVKSFVDLVKNGGVPQE